MTRITVLLPALVCPNCGAWDAEPSGRRAVRIVDTERIGDTRRQAAICRACGAKFLILTNPKIERMEVLKSDTVGDG